MSTNAVPIGMGALDDKELFVVEGSENWRSTPGQPGGARKMRKNRHNQLTSLNCELECLQTPAMN